MEFIVVMIVAFVVFLGLPAAGLVFLLTCVSPEAANTVSNAMHTVDSTWCLPVDDDTYVQLYDGDKALGAPGQVLSVVGSAGVDHRNGKCISTSSVKVSEDTTLTVRTEWLTRKQGHFVGTQTQTWTTAARTTGLPAGVKLPALSGYDKKWALYRAGKTVVVWDGQAKVVSHSVENRIKYLKMVAAGASFEAYDYDGDIAEGTWLGYVTHEDAKIETHSLIVRVVD